MGEGIKIRKRYNITIDSDVMDAIHRTAQKMGLSASRFIEICMKANTQMTGPVQDLLKGLFTEFVEADREMTVEQKKEALGMGEELFLPVEKKKRGRPKKP